MISQYLSKVAVKAFAPTIRIMDGIGIVLPPIVGAFYWLTGQIAPDMMGEIVGPWVLSGALMVLLLRLVSAPYLVWKDERIRVEELVEKLYEPRRLAKEHIRGEFTKDRVELIREFLAIQADMRAYNEAAHLGVETAGRLYKPASPFLSSADFKRYWFTFEKNLKACSALSVWYEENSPLSQADQLRVLPRWGLHHTLIHAAIEGMTIWLAAEDGHEAAFEKLASQKSLYDDVDLTFALPPRAGFDEIDWFIEGEWSPPIGPPKPATRTPP